MVKKHGTVLIDHRAIAKASSDKRIVHSPEINNEESRQSQKQEIHNADEKVIEAKSKLNRLVKQSETEIFSVKAVFPFDLFPDQIIIEVNKVTFVHKYLLSKNSFTALIENILTVDIARGPVFASVMIEIKGFDQGSQVIKFLWPKDAQKVKTLIMGLVDAKRTKIDLSVLTTKEIRERLERIGDSGEHLEKLS